MTEERKSRAEKAGEQLGGAIVEMANLMYNNDTKARFYKGLFTALKKDATLQEILKAWK